MQENYLPVTNTSHQNDPLYSLEARSTVFEHIDLGALVVTPDVLSRVEFERTLESYLPFMPKNHRRVLNAILKFNADSKELYFSQVNLARKLQMGLSTVKRALYKFKELGILQWVFRGVKKTCLYTLSPFMSSKSVREKFVSLVSGFAFIPMALLLSNNTHLFASQNCVQIASGLQGTNVENIFSQSLSLKTFSLSRFDRYRLERLSVCITACARERSETKPTFLPKNEGMIVKQNYSHSLAIAAAANVSSIRLTAYGRLVVGCYPAEAIKAADIEMKRMKNVQNPIALFVSMCKKYCDKNSMRPDYSRLNEFKNENPGWQTMSEYEETTPPTKQDRPESEGKLIGYQDPYATKYAYLKNDTRNHAAFDRKKEWDDAIEVIKEKKIAGEEIDPFKQYMLDLDVLSDDAAPERMVEILINRQTNTVKDAIIGVHDVPYIELDDEDKELIENAIAHHDLLGASGDRVLTAIREVKAQGATHPRVQDGSFRQGLHYVKSLIDRLQAVPYDMQGAYDPID